MQEDFVHSNVSRTLYVIRDVSGISDEAMFILTWAIFGVVCQIIDVFGIITNIINIICFVKQGFKESMNVSLLGLSISDLCSLIPLVFLDITYTPSFRAADLTFEPMEVNYIVTALPHLTFTHISSWITALVTLERCLCVTAPLKIKSIITTGRVSAVIIIVYIGSFCSIAPVYTVNGLDMKFSPYRNKTIFGLVFMANRDKVEKITFIINNFILSFVSFTIIVMCTIILVIKLNSSTKWRIKSANELQAQKVSDRNVKVAKMVVMISTLFIVCFVPISIAMLALAFEPEMFNGRYIKIGILVGGLSIMLESINSSVNIFIYYHMSSRYRTVFNEIMCKVKT